MAAIMGASHHLMHPETSPAQEDNHADLDDLLHVEDEEHEDHGRRMQLSQMVSCLAFSTRASPRMRACTHMPGGQEIAMATAGENESIRRVLLVHRIRAMQAGSEIGMQLSDQTQITQKVIQEKAAEHGTTWTEVWTCYIAFVAHDYDGSGSLEGSETIDAMKACLVDYQSALRSWLAQAKDEEPSPHNEMDPTKLAAQIDCFPSLDLDAFLALSIPHRRSSDKQRQCDVCTHVRTHAHPHICTHVCTHV